MRYAASPVVARHVIQKALCKILQSATVTFSYANEIVKGNASVARISCHINQLKREQPKLHFQSYQIGISLLTLVLFCVIDVGNISNDKWVLINLGDSIFSTNSMEFSSKTPSTSVTADILKKRSQSELLKNSRHETHLVLHKVLSETRAQTRIDCYLKKEIAFV